MNDMRAVIIPKSDQINADDLIGGPIAITIERVTIRPGTEQPVSIHFVGDSGKPYKPCKSMCRVLVSMWGPDANNYVGRGLTLYADPAVLWGGMKVGGIRISNMTDITEAHTMALTATKGSRKPFTVKPMAKPQAKPAESAAGAAVSAETVQGESAPAADVPAEEDRAKWAKWATKIIEKIAVAKDIAALNLLDQHVRARLSGYSEHYGATKALELQELITVRRAELTGGTP